MKGNNMNNLIAFDIETKPIIEAVAEFNEFKPEDVKLGNLKDEEKIKAKLKEAEKKFWKDAADKAALNPLTAEICALGWKSATDTTLLINKPEKEIISAFWQLLSDLRSGALPTSKLIGFNIMPFDLPFLIKRSWLLGITVPDIRNGRYYDRIFVDLREQWHLSQFGWDKMHGKLEDVARILKCGSPKRPKYVSGKDFHKIMVKEPKKAENYLEADLEDAYNIGKRIL